MIKTEKTLNINKQINSISHKELYERIRDGGVSSITEGEETKILVIPLNFSDYSFSDEYRLNNNELKQHLKVAFNSNGENDTGYWESVSSYFYKSSNGKLNLSFDIADVYTCSQKASELLNFFSAKFINMLQEVITFYENKGYDFNKYDNDLDGEIDAIWFVYSAPHFEKNTALKDKDKTFWAFVNADGGNKVLFSECHQPAFYKFAWASFSFLYEDPNSKGYDTHTFIHETSHLLGLDDYYDDDDNSNRSPLGGHDMQDSGFGDHNSLSKALLGWNEPIIFDVSNSSSEKKRITIRKNTPLFITNKYNGTYYDEFIIFELYAPTGLNKLDATIRNIMPNTTGIKVLHADCRLMCGSSDGSTFVYNNYSNYRHLEIGARNSSKTTKTGYDRLTMISSKIGGGKFLTSKCSRDENDLFKEGDIFNLYEYREENTKDNSGRLNNGSTLDVDVEIKEIGEDYAILIVTNTSKSA